MTAVMVSAGVDARVAALRDEFDQLFAQPEHERAVLPRSVLAMRFDTAPYAVALDEVAELGRAPAILAVPSQAQTFLGLIALRGALLPAHDLAALLGHSRGVTQAWLLLIRTPHPLAFIFDEFEGHRHIAAAEHAGDAVRDADVWRPLIRLSTLIQTLPE